MQKRCPKCNQAKLLREFYKRKTGKRSGQYYERCKACMRERGKKYYYQNHERQLYLAITRKKKSYYERREIVNKLKDVPCADCGIRYPFYVMDFDHKDSNDKIGNVAHLLRMSTEKLLSEISKCEVVCSNCHRIRTYSKLHAEVAKVVTADA